MAPKPPGRSEPPGEAGGLLEALLGLLARGPQSDQDLLGLEQHDGALGGQVAELDRLAVGTVQYEVGGLLPDLERVGGGRKRHAEEHGTDDRHECSTDSHDWPPEKGGVEGLRRRDSTPSAAAAS